MDSRQEIEEILNANGDLFCKVQDELDYICERLGLDPEKYSFYITVHEEEDANS